LWFGTSLGLSRFEPSPDSPAPPTRVFITGFAVNGVAQALADPGVTQLSEIRLAPDQRQLQFDFVGVGAPADEVLSYQYRLVGADSRWSAPSPGHSVDYAALTPGRYRFEVRAVKGGSSALSAMASASFELSPPFWRSWSFLVAAMALSVGLAYFAHRYHLSRQLELERTRLRIATDLHDDLGASLTRVAILSELAGRDAGGAAGNGPLLGEIAETSRDLLDGLSDLVWCIDPRRDDMHSMVRRLRHFASSLLEAKGIQLVFDIGQESERLSLRLDQRRHLFLIFKEAIQNAARHSDCRSLLVSLAVVDGECLARVKDDGKGLPEPLPESGNGLDSIGRRAQALGGRLQIVSRSPYGVAVEVRFPERVRNYWASRLFANAGRTLMLLRRASHWVEMTTDGHRHNPRIDRRG